MPSEKCGWGYWDLHRRQQVWSRVIKADQLRCMFISFDLFLKVLALLSVVIRRVKHTQKPMGLSSSKPRPRPASMLPSYLHRLVLMLIVSIPCYILIIMIAVKHAPKSKRGHKHPAPQEQSSCCWKCWCCFVSPFRKFIVCLQISKSTC